MKRLLCIVGSMNVGGAETFLMKLYRNIDKSKYQMDFCVMASKKGYYDDEIINMGGKIYSIIPKSKNPIKSFTSIYKIIKENKYDYVLRTSQNSLSALELVAAKFAGAKIRVFRSSNSHTMKKGLENIIHKIFKFLPNIIANVKMAPSSKAATFMFGSKKNVLILKNGIPLEKYEYSEQGRLKIRKENNIEKDAFIVGHIGRFNEQKNHEFLIEVFNEINKKVNNSKLLLVGIGELENKIKEKVKNMGLSNSVIFLGIRDDIADILSAIDVFVFPSYYEGMPNTIIEAQANGVPCIISENITKEVKICSNVIFEDIKKSPNLWANEILKNSDRVDSKLNCNKLKDNGYDINSVCEIFIKNIFE